MQDPVKITITQCYFEPQGLIEVFGITEQLPVEWSIDCSDREWDRMLDTDYFTIHDAVFLNHKGEYVGRFDNYHNLHLLVEVGGQVLERVVRLKSYLEQKLLNEYHKSCKHS